MQSLTSKRLLLISHHNSYRIAPYIKAATNLNLEVTIASEGKHSLVSEVASGIHINFSNVDSAIDSILSENKLKPFAGILGSDDQTVELAAHIAKALALPHNPPTAAKCSHRKDLARAQLALAACPVPIHCLIDLSLPLDRQIKGLPWPCVLKPLNMSASRGVIRADNEDEFTSACERLRTILATVEDEFEQNHVLVEDYIDGIEIAYEGFLQNGVLNTITIFDKPDPLTGPYFAETIYVTPTTLSNEIQSSIQSVIQQACNAYGLRTGAVHAECRIDNKSTVWILEIASRTIGGDCGRLLDNENFSVEELAISLAFDHPIKTNLPEQARGVMMIPIKQSGLLKRVEGLLLARKVENIDKVDIIIREGNELTPLPEGNQYLGYIFASGKSAEIVTASLREAYKHLKFIVTPIFKIT